MNRTRFVAAVGLVYLVGCSAQRGVDNGTAQNKDDQLSLDPQTGIPYASVYQYPIQGFNASDLGFGFGSMNDLMCMARNTDGECISYGYHLAHDTQVGKTPYGTVVMAPADGIVRITTDITFQGYGSTSSKNASYYGCVIVLEHEYPNGKPFTTLLGHVQCESGSAYDPTARTGNPAKNAIVRRGQYVGHIGHYWYGSSQATDWHHLHWGNRKGSFAPSAYTRSGLRPWVRGYAARSEFSQDPQTGKLIHPDWVDPVETVATLGDPAQTPDVGIRHHPPGSMLGDGNGSYWLVTGESQIAPLTSAVIATDRYDISLAANVTAAELECYAHAAAVSALGAVTPYQRPGTHAVVMAYDLTHERYDVIRQEALSSWGYSNHDLTSDASKIQTREQTYAAHGYRQLRPGSLIKANEQTEVAIVTPWQTRRAIATGETFEQLGYDWSRVVSIPQDVLDAVAGNRESQVVSYASIFDCALPAPCPSDGTCGGGDDPEDYSDGGDDSGDAGTLPAEAGQTTQEICNGLDDDGNGQIDEIFQCKLGATNGPTCVSSCGTAGQRVCEAPNCAWGACKPLAENCGNTIDDDCNGLIDCADPACLGQASCQAVSDAGAAADAQDSQGNLTVKVHFSYSGPATSGSIILNAWWQPPNAEPRVWAQVAPCTDTVPGDGLLACDFTVPSGTAPLEFQVNLPDGRFWGDESCYPTGGCGATIGSLSVSGPGGPFTVKLVPNNSSNQPYYNGHIDKIL